MVPSYTPENFEQIKSVLENYELDENKAPKAKPNS